MSGSDHFVPGDWNAVCWDCGRKFKASTMRRNWQGFYECQQHWTPRQPQDFVRSIPDLQTAPWVQPQTFEQRTGGIEQYTEAASPFVADFAVTTAQAAARTVRLTVGAQGPYPVTVAVTEGATTTLTLTVLSGGSTANPQFGWA